MFVYLCVEVDGKDIWLIVFIDIMKMLINKVDLLCDIIDEFK